jgi:hypothetical protein
MTTIGTTLALAIDTENGDMVVRTCASNCTLPASWTESPPMFIFDGWNDVVLKATSTGGLRLAYNQGTSAAGQPANIKAQDNRLLVWSCESNCLVDTSWSGVMLGGVSEGKNGISMTTVGQATAVVAANTVDVVAQICSSGCGTGTNWVAQVVDSLAQMSADMDPYLYATGCTSGGSAVRAQFAGWLPASGSVGIGPTGTGYYAHAPYGLRQCPGETGVTYLPTLGRVVVVPP